MSPLQHLLPPFSPDIMSESVLMNQQLIFFQHSIPLGLRPEYTQRGVALCSALSDPTQRELGLETTALTWVPSANHFILMGVAVWVNGMSASPQNS